MIEMVYVYIDILIGVKEFKLKYTYPQQCVTISNFSEGNQKSQWS